MVSIAVHSASEAPICTVRKKNVVVETWSPLKFTVEPMHGKTNDNLTQLTPPVSLVGYDCSRSKEIPVIFLLKIHKVIVKYSLAGSSKQQRPDSTGESTKRYVS